jgi:adenylate cyclase
MSNGPHSPDDTLWFEGYRLDRFEGLSRLNDSGRWDPVAAGSRAVDILKVLAEHRGQLATKQALMDAVWPGIAVEDANLTVQISALRRILDEGREGASCIQTVIGRGYRFLPEVTTLEADSSVAISSMATDAPVPGSRPRLSIVVFPFVSLSSDPDARHFADIVTRNLTTDLSRLPDAFVMAQAGNGTHQTLPVNVQQTGVEFGVNYVVQGSIRRDMPRTEVSVQLIDVETNAHIWAERFDIDSVCIANAHDDVTGRLMRIIYLKLTEEMNRRIEALPLRDWTQSDYFIHGRAMASRPQSVENRLEAMRCFEQALGMDPESAGARVGIASILISNAADGWSQSLAQDTARAELLLTEALRRDADDTVAHTYVGMLRREQGRLSDARIELDIAIGLRRDNILAIYQLGITLIFLGQPMAAIPHLERCLRLAPHDTYSPFIHTFLGQSKLLLGHVEDAIFCLRNARASNPRLWYTHMLLAAGLGLRGELDDAGNSLREAIEMRPSIGSQSGVNWVLTMTSPDFVRLYRKTVYAGLLLAGLPLAVPHFVPLPDE